MMEPATAARILRELEGVIVALDEADLSAVSIIPTLDVVIHGLEDADQEEEEPWQLENR